MTTPATVLAEQSQPVPVPVPAQVHAIVSGLDIPFGDLVWLLTKLAFASVFALITVGLVMLIPAGLLFAAMRR
jgi:hypothetical protein